ncbi:hypothetical protein BDF19DRAFT_424579 [Syncephalis fuscata]|nr:hypothetical protein BDF19DRAFT_424579 [Syncephalis fuscata]
MARYLCEAVASQSKTDLTELLNMKDRQGRTSLSLAQQWRHIDIVQWLTALNDQSL